MPPVTDSWPGEGQLPLGIPVPATPPHPPVIAAIRPLATFWVPPVTDSRPELLQVALGRVAMPARLSQPPVIDATVSLARLLWPPAIEASVPLAVLDEPPVTEDWSPVALLRSPPLTAAM